MEQVKEPRKRRRHPDRITLNPVQLDKLSRLVQDASKKLGEVVKLTRKDILGCLIDNHPETLSAGELSHLRRRHLTETKYAEWLLKTVREKEAKGESVSLVHLIRSSAKSGHKASTKLRSRDKAVSTIDKTRTS